MKILVVTNDFPPRPGGIQVYVHAFVSRLPPDAVIVYASRWGDAAGYDSAQPFPVVRERTGMLLPTPAVARRAGEIARAESATAVWFGAAAPLGLLAPGLRRSGVPRLVGSTHGHEVGWAALPVARGLLRRIGQGLDAITYLGEYTGRRLAAALGPAAERMVAVPSGVDASMFNPEVPGEEVRRRHRLGSRPVVVCVSRLVPRKGQDVLIRAMPRIRREVPGTALLVVGDGPYRRRLARLASDAGVDGDVVFTGEVPWAELPAHYAAGDVFAMPCRTRRGGLDVEGLGLVFLEASATGLPVVAGDSGGAPGTVLEGRTGHVVDGRSIDAVTDRVVALLRDEGERTRMGREGRSWVRREWSWDLMADRMRALLAAGPPSVTARGPGRRPVRDGPRAHPPSG